MNQTLETEKSNHAALSNEAAANSRQQSDLIQEYEEKLENQKLEHHHLLQSTLDHRNEILTSEIDSIKIELSRTENELKEASESLERTTNQLQQSNESNEKLSEALKFLQNNFDLSNQENKKLESLLDKATEEKNSIQTKLTQIEDENTSSIHTIQILEQQLTDLQLNFVDESTKLDDYSSKFLQLQKSNEEKDEALTAANQSLTEIESNHQSFIFKLKSSVVELEDKLDLTRSEFEEKEHQLLQAVIKNQEAEAEIAKVKDKLESANKTIQTTETENANLKIELESINCTVEDLNSKCAELNRIKEELELHYTNQFEEQKKEFSNLLTAVNDKESMVFEVNY